MLHRLLVSTCCVAFAIVQLGQAQDAKQSDREQAIAWVRDNNTFGPDHQLVKDVRAYLDGLPTRGHGFQMQLSGDLVNSGKAMRLVGWRERFWVFELPAETKLPRGTLTKLTTNPSGSDGGVFAIQPPMLDAGASLPSDKPFTGKVAFKIIERKIRGFPAVRLTTYSGGNVTVSYSHYPSEFIKKDMTEFKFKFDSPKELKLGPGPALLFMDLVEFGSAGGGGTPFVASNPVAVQVNVTGDAAKNDK